MSEKPVLYVFDENLRQDLLVREVRQLGSRQFVLCPVTSNQDVISTVADKLLCALHAPPTIVPFGRLLHEKAFATRSQFIEFTSDLGKMRLTRKKNAKEYFQCGSKAFSLWWFSQIAEKSPLKSGSFHKLVSLLTVLEVASQHGAAEIWLDLANRDLSLSLIDHARKNGLKYRTLRSHRSRPVTFSLLSTFVFAAVFLKSYIVRAWRIKRSMREQTGRKERLKQADWLLATYFPLVDEAKLGNRQFVNKYYEPLQKALEEAGMEEVAWLGIIVERAGYELRDCLQLGLQVNRWGHTLVFIEEYLKLSDMAGIVRQYLTTAAKFIIRLPILSRAKYPEGDISIWRLFDKDWLDSFCGWRLLQGLIFYKMFSRMLEDMTQKSTVVYLAEMYAWEKALNIAAREKGCIKTVGVQHTAVPLLQLNFFNQEDELSEGDYVQTVPKPDYLACAGQLPLKILRDAGWSEDRLFRLGAIRFHDYKRLLANPVAWTSRNDDVVVALSIDPNQSKEILSLVHAAFRTGAPYRIMIKGHPFCPVPPLIASMAIELDPNIFQVVDAPLTELLPKAKAMIVTGSAASLEALACQCPVVIPQLTSVLDMSPLAAISELTSYVENPQQLREAVDRIVSAKTAPLSLDECLAFIQQYFDLLGSDAEYLARLKNRLASGQGKSAQLEDLTGSLC